MAPSILVPCLLGMCRIERLLFSVTDGGEATCRDAERDEIEAHAEKCLHCKLAILEHKAEKSAQTYLETFYPTTAGVQEELIAEGFPMEARKEIEE